MLLVCMLAVGPPTEPRWPHKGNRDNVSELGLKIIKEYLEYTDFFSAKSFIQVLIWLFLNTNLLEFLLWEWIVLIFFVV